MTPQTFRARYPEFNEVSPNLIAQVLAEAEARMGGPDASVWGGFAQPNAAGVQAAPTLADVAHGALAADILITGPFGASLGLKSTGDGPSIYRRTFDELVESVAGGFLVAGGAGLWPPQVAQPSSPALAFSAGTGTVAVSNGSTAVTFSSAQTLLAGTLVAFGAQPGAYYSILDPIVGATGGVLAAPYNGVSSAASTWVHT